MQIERTHHVDASEPDVAGLYEYFCEYDMFRFSDGSNCIVARSYVEEPDEAHFLRVEIDGRRRSMTDADLADSLLLAAQSHLQSIGAFELAEWSWERLRSSACRAYPAYLIWAVRYPLLADGGHWTWSRAVRVTSQSRSRDQLGGPQAHMRLMRLSPLGYVGPRTGEAGIMRTNHGFVLGVLMLSCGLSHAADPGSLKENYLDLRTYMQSVQMGYLTEQCLKAAPAQGALMQSAMVQWRVENGDSERRGSVAALRFLPDMGKTSEEQADAIRAQAVSTFAAELASTPDMTCRRGLNGIRFNIPVEIHGATLADRNLRYDIFKQAVVPWMDLMQCTDFDALEAQVVSDKGTGAERVIEERWTLRGCGRQQAATITFGPSLGGTGFVVAFPNVQRSSSGASD